MEDDAEWRDVLLEELAAPTRNALVGGPFGSDLVQSDYSPSGVPVIRGENLSVGRWVGGDFVFVPSNKATKLAANTAGPLDIVFTQRGANHYRQVAVVPGDAVGRFVISQSQMKLTVDLEKADPLFIYYVFRSPTQQEYLQRNAIQTGVPHTNLSILRKVPLRIPSLATQRTISRNLGTLDDKIELNQRMNETLEAMARVLFKSWFVDFDPVRAKAEGRDLGLPKSIADLFPDRLEDSEVGEIPSGWEVRALDDVSNFLNGLALQKYPASDGQSLPVIKIAQLRKGDSEGADQCSTDIPPEYVIDDGDVLFSWSGSLECVLWTGGKGALNQHLFKVTSEQFPKWFYYLWVHQHLSDFRHIAAGKATTMGHIQRHHLKEAKVVVPDSKALEKMESFVAPLLGQVIQQRIQSRTLATLRDTLLPKLISGELRVKRVERTEATI